MYLFGTSHCPLSFCKGKGELPKLRGSRCRSLVDIFHSNMGACGSTVRGPVLDQEDKRELLMAITINRDFDRIKSTIDRYPGIDLNRIDLDGVS